MHEPSPVPAALLVGAREEAKAYLRIEGAAEDKAIDQLVAAAAALAEAFTAQMLLVRSATEAIPARRDWTRLASCPVRSVTRIEAMADTGATALPATAYDVDIGHHGEGWVRVADPVGLARLRVTLTAGLGADWTALPEPVRLGILRLAAHGYTHRDASEDAGPPAAVAALLRPWRRMRII